MSTTTKQTNKANVAANSAAEKVAKLDVAKCLTVIVRALSSQIDEVRDRFSALTLSALRAGTVTFQGYSVVRKVAEAIAKGRASLAVVARKDTGDVIRLSAKLGAESIELRGLSIPREWAVELFDVSDSDIEALSDAAQDSLPV